MDKKNWSLLASSRDKKYKLASPDRRPSRDRLTKTELGGSALYIQHLVAPLSASVAESATTVSASIVRASVVSAQAEQQPSMIFLDRQMTTNLEAFPFFGVEVKYTHPGTDSSMFHLRFCRTTSLLLKIEQF